MDITSGKFVFSTAEAYMIEDGKITHPVKDDGVGETTQGGVDGSRQMHALVRGQERDDGAPHAAARTVHEDAGACLVGRDGHAATGCPAMEKPALESASATSVCEASSGIQTLTWAARMSARSCACRAAGRTRRIS